ncbi:MAG: hypothetical protein HC836_11350 [Richelia sp. RM2_1_2]|nr:hypothetical protein [Richelia sp. RM2_1_2]
MTKTSPSSNSHKKIGKQPNTKIRKLRKKIKKYHQNIQDKTVTSTGIISYSNRRQKNQKRKTFATSMLAIAILLGSGGLVIMLGWISILFIFNPQQVSWLNDFVPGWVKIGSSSQQSPRTMQQIQSEIQKQKRIVGEIIALESDIDESFLLPVFRQRNNCHSDCKSIVELRTYHLATDFEWRSTPEKYYHLTTQFSVTGLEEDQVIAPLIDANVEKNPGSSIPLPISEIGRFDKDAPSPGIWYYLRGDRSWGTNQTAYGYILHYNGDRRSLQQMISWTSPTGDLPQWQQITGDDEKELVVRQTVGLEPRLRVYQVQPSEYLINPIKLSEITLTPPAFNDGAYKDALLIAQSGLWTPAEQWLQFIQKQQKGKITAAAQAQIDLIRLHSQLTKKLADTSWASPSQQVLAYLIDGRWGEALKVFEASPQNTVEIKNLLKVDTGRLENRIDAALQVNPNRSEVQAWKALIIASQKGTNQADNWLNTQSKISQDSSTYIKKLLTKI